MVVVEVGVVALSCSESGRCKYITWLGVRTCLMAEWQSDLFLYVIGGR